jgi:hypothetical protein
MTPRREKAIEILRLLKIDRRFLGEINKALDSFESSARMPTRPAPKRKVDAHLRALQRALDTMPYPNAEFATAVRKQAAFAQLVWHQTDLDDENSVKELNERDWLKNPLRMKAVPPRRSAFRQKMAVLHARALLDQFGLKATLYRKGTWHQIAGIFLGEPNAVLWRQLKAYRDSE